MAYRASSQATSLGSELYLWSSSSEDLISWRYRRRNSCIECEIRLDKAKNKFMCNKIHDAYYHGEGRSGPQKSNKSSGMDCCCLSVLRTHSHSFLSRTTIPFTFSVQLFQVKLTQLLGSGAKSTGVITKQYIHLLATLVISGVGTRQK